MEPKEHPILFNGEMVRAILDGRKIQTRRVIRRQPPRWVKIVEAAVGRFVTMLGRHPSGKCGHEKCACIPVPGNSMWTEKCPYGQPGNRLWVRESIRGNIVEPGTWRITYVADGASVDLSRNLPGYGLSPLLGITKSRPVVPSIHMPRWASRITLEVVSVRVERVQEISRDDAIAEGIESSWDGSAHWYKDYSKGAISQFKQRPVWSFRSLWDSINAKRGLGWDVNPYVWVIEFKVI